MMNLAAVCGVLVILPFLLGYIHTGSKSGFHVTRIYYRYFAFINIVVSAFFVAGRMFLVGPKAAAISGWAYSPVFHLYGIALLSIGLMGLWALFKQDRMMIVPAVCWSIFLVLSSVSHLYQVDMHQIKDVSIILVHVAYNLAVAIVLMRFVSKINHHYRDNEQVAVQ